MTATIDALIRAEDLPADYAAVVEQYWAPLADYLLIRKQQDRPLLVGVNGAQGSGKSTLCRFLVPLLEERGLRAAALSLDDFYLTRAERQRLAVDVHPLFATRGVPGTHDTALLGSVLRQLLRGQQAEAPTFNKAADDRDPAPRLVGPADLILLEGWCVGAAPQRVEDLREPVNELERTEDPDRLWRTEVNRQLRTCYSEVFAILELLVMLAVPSFEAVRSNRGLQEQKLARSNPTASAVMDEAGLDRFIMHYERLTRCMLAEMPGRADVTFRIGSDQRPIGLPAALAGSLSAA